MKKQYWICALILILTAGLIAWPYIAPKDPGNGSSTETQVTSIPYWTDDSQAMASIMTYVESVCDPSSEQYREKEDRIAVFDFNGTLYGELYPTYFDTWLSP